MNIEIIKEYFTLKVNDKDYCIEFERHDHLSSWTMRIVSIEHHSTLYTRTLAADITVNAELAQGIIETYMIATGE